MQPGPPPGPPAGPPSPYGPPPPHGGYYPPPVQPTNTLAIISLVCAFVFAPAGIICGVIARRQIKQTGEQGDGLALAGIIIGWCFVGLFVLFFMIWLVMFVLFAAVFASIPWDTFPSGTPSPFPTS